MSRESIAADLKELLPDRPDGINNIDLQQGERLLAAAEGVQRKHAAKELALLKNKERYAAKRAEIERSRRERGIPEGRTEYQHEMLSPREEEERARVAAEVAIRNSPEVMVEDNIVRAVIASPTATPAEKLAVATTTTRADVTRLLSSLNLNLNMRLSKNDMSNLVACLLTCNEAQLRALASNAKVPIVIKTLIKRLQDDMKVGNMSTINDLWDRVFGKAGMLQDPAPTSASGVPADAMQGLIPGQPISREAYVLLRETLIK